MKLHLFREMLELNQAFEQVLAGLRRMEKERLFQRDIVRYARAEVEGASVDANREFFDKFDEIVEDNASWAYQFQRDYDRKAKDVEDLYLEIKEREEARIRKGLPPRFVILPNWVMDDEKQYDERQAAKRKRSAKRRKKPSKRKPHLTEQSRLTQRGVSSKPESGNEQ